VRVGDIERGEEERGRWLRAQSAELRVKNTMVRSERLRDEETGENNSVRLRENFVKLRETPWLITIIQIITYIL